MKKQVACLNCGLVLVDADGSPFDLGENYDPRLPLHPSIVPLGTAVIGVPAVATTWARCNKCFEVAKAMHMLGGQEVPGQ